MFPLRMSFIHKKMNSSEISEDANLPISTANGLYPIDVEQVLDCLRKKKVDRRPLPPNNIIEFKGIFDIEKLKGIFFYICGHELIIPRKIVVFMVVPLDINTVSMVY